MDDRTKLARILVTIPAVFVTLVTPIVDVNDSHVVNPLWTAHARLHTAWLISTGSLLGLFVLWTMWRGPQAGTVEGVRLGGTIVAAILGGFMIAAATTSLYGGALTAPAGVPPVGGVIDANLFAFSILSVLLVVAHRLTRRSTA